MEAVCKGKIMMFERILVPTFYGCEARALNLSFRNTVVEIMEMKCLKVTTVVRWFDKAK